MTKPTSNKILLFVFFLVSNLLSAFGQNIKVRTDEKKVFIKKSAEENDFYISITITNNSQDTLRVPPANSTLDDVWIKIPPHPEWYLFDKLLIHTLANPIELILLPQASTKIRLKVIGSIFHKKGKIKVWFYPVITRLRDQKKIQARSNKMIVNVE